MKPIVKVTWHDAYYSPTAEVKDGQERPIEGYLENVTVGFLFMESEDSLMLTMESTPSERTYRNLEVIPKDYVRKVAVLRKGTKEKDEEKWLLEEDYQDTRDEDGGLV